MLLFAAAVSAQSRWNSTYQQYVDQYKDLAIEQMKRYKIPASITLAQGLLESGAGRSELARKGNNHFGIKCHSWNGRTVYFDDDANQECFRAYSSVSDSYEDHSQFLTTGRRYQNLFKLSITDYKGWARGLKAAGYATNPKYADRLIDIIQVYSLHQYDTAKSYDRFYAKRGRDHNVGGAALHAVYKFNDNYYVKARKGDTFAAIAAETGISRRRLARYNERDKNDILAEGDIVYLKKKRRKAPKEYKGRLHYVRPGQSMYTISQLYGIRLKCLYKLNGLTPDYQIKVGDSLRVR